MRVLVTGASGFIGCYLVEKLLKEGAEVTGTYYQHNAFPGRSSIEKDARLVRCDIRQKKQVEKLMDLGPPDEIYHLAAQSLPVLSWKEPVRTMDTNVNGTIHLAEGLRSRGWNPRLFMACSSAEYGLVKAREPPFGESHSLNPLHPYGVSKVGQDLLGYQYFMNHKMNIIRGRLFNTTGPRKVQDVCSDFVHRIALIERRGGKLRVGNLTPTRDITDARDMVDAIIQLTRQGTPGDVYNLCSSRSISIQYVLDTLRKAATRPIEYFQDPQLLRPTDEPAIVGDNSKLRKTIRWKPVIPFRKTLVDMLEYQRELA